MHENILRPWRLLASNSELKSFTNSHECANEGNNITDHTMSQNASLTAMNVLTRETTTLQIGLHRSIGAMVIAVTCIIFKINTINNN